MTNIIVAGAILLVSCIVIIKINKERGGHEN